MDKLDYKTSLLLKGNRTNINTIDFFLFDKYENIKKIRQYNKYKNNDAKDIIFVFIEEGGKSTQKIYKKNDFGKDYLFIQVDSKAKKSKPIGILFPRNRANDDELKNHILNGINNLSFKKDIYKNLKINNSNFDLENEGIQRNKFNAFDAIFHIKEKTANTLNGFRTDNRNKSNENTTTNNLNRNNNNDQKVMVEENPSGNTKSQNTFVPNIDSKIMEDNYLSHKRNISMPVNIPNNNNFPNDNNIRGNSNYDYNYNKDFNNNQNINFNVNGQNNMKDNNNINYFNNINKNNNQNNIIAQNKNGNNSYNSNETQKNNNSQNNNTIQHNNYNTNNEMGQDNNNNINQNTNYNPYNLGQYNNNEQNMVNGQINNNLNQNQYMNPSNINAHNNDINQQINQNNSSIQNNNNQNNYHISNNYGNLNNFGNNNQNTNDNQNTNQNNFGNPNYYGNPNHYNNPNSYGNTNSYGNVNQINNTYPNNYIHQNNFGNSYQNNNGNQNNYDNQNILGNTNHNNNGYSNNYGNQNIYGNANQNNNVNVNNYGIQNNNRNSNNNGYKINQNNNNNIHSNYSQNNNSNQNKHNPPPPSPPPTKPKYYFPEKGLYNIGSTCYMNATLQCLLHVCELIAYFLNEYPNDSMILKKKNKDVESQGNISKSFYDLVKGVISDEKDEDSKGKGLNMFNPNTSFGSKSNKSSIFSFGVMGIFSKSTSPKAFSPDNFKKILGYYNSQFRRFEANDSKDLILYLLQTMHEELNYYGDVVLSRNMFRPPNQFNRVETFLYFNNTYNMRNFSIISTIFYGTYENITFCKECKNYLYNFQKFEFISFGLSDYHRKPFNIYQGFKDNQKEAELKGDNQFYCNQCRKLCNASLTCRIIQPPNKLLINLDYGKNKRYQPSRIDFEEIIDITEFINFNFGCRIKYRIIGVCTHLGISGSFGHYIAYCRHRESGQWYNFNDSSCTKCNKSEIYGGSPYLLLYEKI